MVISEPVFGVVPIPNKEVESLQHYCNEVSSVQERAGEEEGGEEWGGDKGVGRRRAGRR